MILIAFFSYITTKSLSDPKFSVVVLFVVFAFLILFQILSFRLTYERHTGEIREAVEEHRAISGGYSKE